MTYLGLIVANVLTPANDNAPYDPLDYEDFDPSELPADAIYDDDSTIGVDEYMALLSGAVARLRG